MRESNAVLLGGITAVMCPRTEQSEVKQSLLTSCFSSQLWAKIATYVKGRHFKRNSFSKKSLKAVLIIENGSFGVSDCSFTQPLKTAAKNDCCGALWVT